MVMLMMTWTGRTWTWWTQRQRQIQCGHEHGRDGHGHGGHGHHGHKHGGQIATPKEDNQCNAVKPKIDEASKSLAGGSIQSQEEHIWRRRVNAAANGEASDGNEIGLQSETILFSFLNGML